MSITLITGASRGVGEALAWKLAGEGHTVAALARSEKPLQALAEKAEAERLSGAIIPCAVDLRDPDAIYQCVSALENQGPIETLVNNAAGIVARQEGAAFVDLDAVPADGISVTDAIAFVL